MEQLNNNMGSAKINRLTSFLWWAAGVQQDELKKFPTEHAKYTGIGSTVAITAIMAMLTGGYAISRVFDTWFFTIFFAVFWGSVIFVLDRFIVSTIVKNDEELKWKEAVRYIPRIIIAVLLGLIIAMPLKLKIFEKEIAGEIKRYEKEYIASEGKKIRDNYAVQLGSFNQTKLDLFKQLEGLKNAINQAQSRMDQAEYEMTCEAQGGVNCDGVQLQGSGRAGRGSVYREKREKFERLKTEYQEIRQSNLSEKTPIEQALNANQLEINELENKRELEVASVKGVYSISNGILAEMEALSRLSNSKDHPGMGTIITFFTIFFMMIEIAPVLTKWMSKAGPYDYRIAEINHQEKLSRQKLMHDRNETVKNEIESTLKLTKQNLDEKLKSNEAVIEAVSAAQVEIVKEALQFWKQKQISIIAQNPELIIKEVETPKPSEPTKQAEPTNDV